MKQITLFVGVYSYFDILLLQELNKKKANPLISFVTPEMKRFISSYIDNDSEIIWSDFLEVDIEDLSGKYSKYDIEIWINDRTLHFNDSVYEIEIINYHHELMNRLTYLVGSLSVSKIHYISSLYKAVENNEKGNLYLENKKTNEAWLRILSSRCSSIHVYKLPFMFEMTIDPYDGIIKRYTSMYMNFYQWICSRVPSYFESNSLKVFANDESNIVLFSQEESVQKVIECSQESTKGYNEHTIEGKYLCSEKELLQKITSKFGDINIDYVVDHENLSYVDCIFADNLYFRVPSAKSYMLKEGKYNTSGIVDTQNYIDSQFDYYIHKVIPSNNQALLTKKEVVSCGKKLTYYTAGSGEPLIIINAYGISIQAWINLVQQLSQTSYVIVWEARGMLNSEKTVDSLDYVMGVEQQILDIESIVNNENIESRGYWH
ncbi:hypothetical protein FACS1894105_11960 [Clostridia bacterium]|nr:hypothetical protein FACS1894105_11960 [Clostridia bacterium]